MRDGVPEVALEQPPPCADFIPTLDFNESIANEFEALSRLAWIAVGVSLVGPIPTSSVIKILLLQSFNSLVSITSALAFLLLKTVFFKRVLHGEGFFLMMFNFLNKVSRSSASVL